MGEPTRTRAGDCAGDRRAPFDRVDDRREVDRERLHLRGRRSVALGHVQKPPAMVALAKSSGPLMGGGLLGHQAEDDECGRRCNASRRRTRGRYRFASDTGDSDAALVDSKPPSPVARPFALRDRIGDDARPRRGQGAFCELLSFRGLSGRVPGGLELRLVLDVDRLENRRRAHGADKRISKFHVDGARAGSTESFTRHSIKVACFLPSRVSFRRSNRCAPGHAGKRDSSEEP